MDIDLDKKSSLTSENTSFPVELTSIKNAYIPAHWHEEVEILFCITGDVTVQVGKKKFLLRRNQMVVFDSEQIHSIKAKSSLYMFMDIKLDKKRLFSYFPGITSYRLQCLPVAMKNKKYDAYLKMCLLARDIVRINMRDEQLSGMRSDGSVLLLLADLIQYCSDFNKGYENEALLPGGNLVKQAVSYVNDHFQEQISLADMADLCGVSREHFCRIFKKNMEMTFLEYLGHVRIARAASLLITTDRPISEVMEESGFTNQTLFNKTFKQVYGITPREARKKGYI